MNNILFVAVHPDDETLGCGGTIPKHKDNGDKIYWLIITNIDEKDGWNKTLVKNRQKEIEKVSVAYSFDKTYKLDYPTTKLDTIPIGDLIIAIAKVIKEVEPNTIYIPNRSDVHTDHQIAFKAIWSCTKNFRYPFIKRILMYECLSETEFAPALPDNTFIPNIFIDITNYFERKIEIVKIYASEIMQAHYPRSPDVIESHAKFRGSRIGKKYAESFILLHEEL